MVKEIYTRNWDFTLYQVDGRFVISVVFFGLVDFYRSFNLLEENVPTVLEDLKNLSEQIRNNYDDFKPTELIPAITKESPPPLARA